MDDPLLVWCRTKDPAEELDYAVDWSEEIVPGDRVTDVEWSVSVPAGLTVTRTDWSDTVAIGWLSGGEAGVTYSLRCTITTAAPRTFSRKVALRVDEI